MKHYGDITKLNGEELPIVDIITGGSPCQDLSVAGKRAGLTGERSGLFMDQIRIIKEMRNECIRQIQLRGTNEHIRPRFMVWENVPGAFSSNGGEDFRAVLEEVCRVADQNAVIPKPTRGGGKWSTSGCILGSGERGVYSVAWRVHDAQFWGVPQRRKRIALVADFGGNAAPEILFEREGVRGDSAESREAREGTAGDTEKGAGETIKLTQSDPVYCPQGNGIDRADTAGCNGKGWREDQSYTLNTIDRPAVYDARGNGDGTIVNTITGDHQNRITDYTALAIQETTGTLAPGAHAGSYNGQDAYNDMLVIGEGMNVVRRLTPLECTRLQGYPDRWVDIGEWTDSKGKTHKDADSPKYKALGNSIALPFWEWLAERIVNQLLKDGIENPTMASLFDGIGGFPLVFSRCGCIPVWASEIEEFPIAVTKKHFKEGEVNGEVCREE